MKAGDLMNWFPPMKTTRHKLKIVIQINPTPTPSTHPWFYKISVKFYLVCKIHPENVNSAWDPLLPPHPPPPPDGVWNKKNLTTPAYNLAILYVYSRVVLAATSALSVENIHTYTEFCVFSWSGTYIHTVLADVGEHTSGRDHNPDCHSSHYGRSDLFERGNFTSLEL